MSDTFETKVETWLSNGTSRRQRLTDGFHAARHMIRLPEFSVRLATNIVLRVALIAVPFALAWYTQNLSAPAASMAALAIAALQAAIHISNGGFFRTTSEHYDDLSKLLDRAAEVMRDMKIRVNTSGSVENHRRHERAITATLSIIEDYILHMIAGRKGEVTVTFAVYRSLEEGRIEILCRNRGSDRPCGEIVADKGMLAHRACQRGVEPRTVNDIHHFGEEARISPTSSSVSYRSFLILPLFEPDETNPKPYAFITIDCKKPYAFYGKRARYIRARNMVPTLEPYLIHVQQRHRMGEQDVKRG